MAGLLVLIVLLAIVVVAFGAAFRARARRNLERTGADLSAELRAALGPAARVTGPPATAAAGPAAPPPSRAAPAAAPPRAAQPAAGLHFMLIYDVWPDFVQQRGKYRDEHLALAWKAAAAGELQLAGALEEGTGQAFLLFRGSREAAQRFAQADPYVRHGLVKQWRVCQWHTVVGQEAALPVRPGRAS